MEQLFSTLTREDLFIVVGLLVAFIAAISVIVIARIGRGRARDLTEPTIHAPPIPPHESALQEAAARELEPGNETRPATTEPAPGDDIPSDLAARPQVSLPLDPSVRVHKPEEIQRQEPKALSSALANTRSSFFGRIKSLFGGKPAIDAGELEELEEILYTSDLGPQTVQRLLDAVQVRVKSDGASGFEAVRSALKDEMLDIFQSLDGAGTAEATSANKDQNNGRSNGGEAHLHLVQPGVRHGSESYLEGLEGLKIWEHQPGVIMIVGVNGAGKTTTIGKLARRLAQSGRKVLVAAGDTFRAAAGDQLKVWTERASVEIFHPEGVTDPSAVAFMACETAQAKGFDIVIIDTAGRLHTQKNLMEELKKMRRVIEKKIPSAPHEVLLVLDANSGQNALVQAREFNQALDVSGVVLTKLDGSAKGGVALGLAYELKLPIKLIGVGEGIDDLRRFSSREFVDSII